MTDDLSFPDQPPPTRGSGRPAATARPQPGTKARRDPAERSTLLIGLQLACFAILFLYGIFFQFTRALGTPALGLTMAAAVLLWLPIMRWYRQRALFAFAGVAIVYVLVSALGVLHWNTLLFDPGAIPQQAFYAFALPVLVPVFAYYHERVFLWDRPFIVLDNGLFAAAILAKFIGPEGLSLLNVPIIQFFNSEAIFTFLFIRRLYYSRRESLIVRALIVIAVAVTAGSFQSVIVTLFLAGLLIFPQFGRVALLVFLLGFTAVAVAAIPFADAIWQVDPNTGIRIFFWQDAIGRLVDSFGIGQGFGTETIRPVYVLSSTDVTIASVEQEEFIFIGAHNAFVDAAYRMGIAGFAILALYVGGLFGAAARSAAPQRAFDFFVCALLFILLMVNVGLASVNFLFGATVLIGWLVFRRATGFLDPAVSRAIGTAQAAPIGPVRADATRTVPATAGI